MDIHERIGRLAVHGWAMTVICCVAVGLAVWMFWLSTVIHWIMASFGIGFLAIVRASGSFARGCFLSARDLRVRSRIKLV